VSNVVVENATTQELCWRSRWEIEDWRWRQGAAAHRTKTPVAERRRAERKRAFLIVPCNLRNWAIYGEFRETEKKFEHTWGDNSNCKMGNIEQRTLNIERRTLRRRMRLLIARVEDPPSPGFGARVEDWRWRKMALNSLRDIS